MCSSWRAPIATAAAAAIAWVAVVLGAGGGPTPETRRLVPAISAGAIDSIDLSRGKQRVTARRGPDGFVTADGSATDAAVVDALLGAVEHTWVRRLRPGDGSEPQLGLDRPRAITTVGDGDGAVRTLALGRELEGRDLVWVRVDGDAALITATEARPLFPPPLDLLDRRPFRAVEITALAITAAGTAAGSVAGTVGDRPPVIARAGDAGLELELARGRARIDAAELESLLADLRDLEIAPGERGSPVEPLAIRWTGEAGESWLEVVGGCAGESGSVAVTSSAGAGCVPAAGLARARAVAADPLGLVERRLIDPRRRLESAVLRRGGAEVSIDPGGPGRAAATAWIRALDGAASGTPQPAPEPLGPADAEIELRYAGGGVDRLTIRAGDPATARRGDEPVVIPIAGAAGLIAAEPVWFRSRDLIERDPLELASARRDGQALDAEAIAPLVAHLSAERFVAAAATAAHGLARPRAVVELRFDPPPVKTGEPDAYTIEIGAPVDGGCYARLSPGDGAVFVLSRDACSALAP